VDRDANSMAWVVESRSALNFPVKQLSIIYDKEPRRVCQCVLTSADTAQLPEILLIVAECVRRYVAALASTSAAAKVSRSSAVVSTCGEIRSTGEVNSPGARWIPA
jgi:hypothetical protein